MQVHGKCHSLASPALIRWQGSQGHSQGVSLGTDQEREGWRMGLQGQTDFPALATHSQIPFQPERMLQNDFYHLQAKSLTEWDRILGIQAFQKCLYHGVKCGDGFKKKNKTKQCLSPESLQVRSLLRLTDEQHRVQGPGVKQSHTHQVSDRRGLAVLASSLFLLPYASLINGPSVLIPSFHSALSFPSCGGSQDKVGPLLGSKREVVGKNNMHPESRCQLSITQGHQTRKENPGIFFNYVNDESRLLLRPFHQNS